MKNLLLSAAIGDIAGSAYEGHMHRTKCYNDVQVFHPFSHFTDDTVCTFACAEALIKNENVSWLTIADNLLKRCRHHCNAGYGGRFLQWLSSDERHPYYSYGNGSAMRCSAAGWFAKTEDECIRLATMTAEPTHNHPEGIKGAVVTALTIFFLKEGKDKDFIRKEVLEKYYPEWAEKPYASFHPYYKFDVSCQGTVGPAIICFLESKDYVDCLKLAIALGGDADTLAAIAGPMAYAFYKEIPEELVAQAKEMLPGWMLQLNEEFDSTI